MWRWVLILVVVLGLVAGLAAGVLNPQPLTLDLFFVRVGAPFGVLIIVAFALGALVGAMFALIFGIARRSRSAAPATRTESGKALSTGHE